MARVTKPLFSDKASGKFGKYIQFRCGKFVLKIPKISKKPLTEEQKIKRKSFADGANIWKWILTSTQKTNWKNFAKSVRHSKGWFTISLPFDLIEVRIGEKKDWEKCINTSGYNGYQYFISCYLRFGPNGWIDYPNPPPFP